MDRFWEKIAIGDPDDCWEWQAAKTRGGYGNFWDGEHYARAHRYALALETGQMPPPTVLALHSCDNPPCCNPRHLRWGTPADNAFDMYAVRGAWNAPRLVGQRNGNSRWSSRQVREIRVRHSKGQSIRYIAEGMEIPKSTVHVILSGAIRSERD